MRPHLHDFLEKTKLERQRTDQWWSGAGWGEETNGRKAQGHFGGRNRFWTVKVITRLYMSVETRRAAPQKVTVAA